MFLRDTTKSVLRIKMLLQLHTPIMRLHTSHLDSAAFSSCVRFDTSRCVMAISFACNTRKGEQQKCISGGCSCHHCVENSATRAHARVVCVCAYASVTDVSQSASPHAEACPSLGSKPRQEASALTPGAPAAAGREEHPLAPHRGGVRAPTAPSKG